MQRQVPVTCSGPPPWERVAWLPPPPRGHQAGEKAPRLRRLLPSERAAGRRRAAGAILKLNQSLGRRAAGGGGGQGAPAGALGFKLIYSILLVS